MVARPSGKAASRNQRPIQPDVDGRNLLSIEQLAAATGMTVRNIRAHRARGLLPAPHVRDRVGYYDSEHLARLKLIQEMQADGFNLRAIQNVLEATGGRPEQLLSMREAVTAPFEDEESAVFTLQELGKRFSGQATDETLTLAIGAGLLVDLGEGRYEAPTPSLLDSAEEVVARGVPLAHAIAVVSKLRRECRAIAREFVRLFVEDLWEPFAAAGYPEERWAEVTQSIQRLRPLSSTAVLAVYHLTMTEEVEAAFGRELQRLTRKPR